MQKSNLKRSDLRTDWPTFGRNTANIIAASSA